MVTPFTAGSSLSQAGSRQTQLPPLYFPDLWHTLLDQTLPLFVEQNIKRGNSSANPGLTLTLVELVSLLQILRGGEHDFVAAQHAQHQRSFGFLLQDFHLAHLGHLVG